MATENRQNRASQEDEELRLGWRMAGLAFTMSSEAAAGTLVGWLVDYFAGTTPTGLLTGAIIGIAVGMLSFIRGAFQLNKLRSQQDLKKIKPLPPDQSKEDQPDNDWKD